MISISCLGLPLVSVSALVNNIFAGFPVFKVTIAGNTSATTLCFAPKPPPILGLITLIFDFGISNAFAKIRLTWNGICVALVTFNLPYVSSSVNVLKVSIIA